MPSTRQIYELNILILNLKFNSKHVEYTLEVAINSVVNIQQPNLILKIPKF